MLCAVYNCTFYCSNFKAKLFVEFYKSLNLFAISLIISCLYSLKQYYARFNHQYAKKAFQGKSIHTHIIKQKFILK